LVVNADCQESTSSFFTALPNPSDGNFSIQLKNSQLEGDSYLRIVDTKGVLVFGTPSYITKGINIFSINESLVPGMYYVSLTNGSHSTGTLRHVVR
jgi:hypothetical protein